MIEDKDNYCKCTEPWILQAHDDYMCEKCGKRYD